jgi:hypothetical protein
MRLLLPLTAVLSSAILGGAYVVAHRFEIVPGGSTHPKPLSEAWVIDNVTGRARLCGYEEGGVIYCEIAANVDTDPPPASRTSK